MNHYTGAVPTTEPADTWRKNAACSAPQYDGHEELWFARTTDHDAIEAAKQICRGCPVAQACGEYALTERIGHGVWGGMTTAQRKAILRRLGRGKGRPKKAKAEPKQPREPASCGTRGGYRKHLREKTVICPPCRQANTDADNRLRRTGTTKADA